MGLSIRVQATLLRRRACKSETLAGCAAAPGNEHQARRARADDRQLMGSDSALKLDYLSLAEIAERPAAWWQNVLGVAAYDAVPPQAPAAENIPMVSVQTPAFAGDARRYEVWQSTHAAQSGTRGRIQYRLS